MSGRRTRKAIADQPSIELPGPAVYFTPTRVNDVAQPLSSQVIAAVSALFDVVREPLAMLSADGSVLLASPPLLSLVGAPASLGSVLSWPGFRSYLFSAFGSGEAWERLNAQLHQAYGRQSFRVIQHWPETREVVVDATPSVLGGHFGGLAIAFQDVSGLHSVDQFSTQVLEALSSALASPLSTLLGFAELLLQDANAELTPEQHEYLSVIRDNAHLEATLVSQLLELGRIRTGNTDLHVTSVEVPWLIDGSIANITETLRQHQTEVHVELPPQLPEVAVDPELAKGVIGSLLLRAQRRNPPGQPIEVSGNVSRRFVNLEVQDFGPRMTPAQQGRLMRLPYVLPQATDLAEYQEELNLAKAQATTAVLGGELRISSGFNTGSILSLGLPIAS
ncbi:MAG: hypothetical protein M1296_07470 [Chloroflexi bacterium]|nr:hypothetical protein [Chloroflexota bacterium]